jgi:hypothetical protein
LFFGRCHSVIVLDVESLLVILESDRQVHCKPFDLNHYKVLI